ncbi:MULTISPECIES: DUF948 domain-containing protein [unclassified Pseudoclavibacter]|uniref:DUF948 domain-containing protein n=1 Tax=unclassified Pseudoclavibacter TaxID=2615177 RepID=UPI001301811B|nr:MULTISPECIES: DUF948 domain-containing protein [unclassified Pseudoclavibacter]KAB1646428.1 DUF948 domain-containing protein [Pseudoclavibacter sp. CFCC 14310]KAB1658224.1 DUF948 domain-containing protein [Pseudoclavibacter sp. CFCC 11306]KAB1661866.1 DUF948 domain-containing protein [Pseudoclavibacter sp. CFCC 13796]KAB1663412.1 DUF948 domain-containing protein [Pseudoclavibacter sp. CFCC 13611]
MTGGDIAALIAAIAFVVLVAVLIVPLWKLGHLLDEARESVRDLTDNVAPLIEESTATVAEANRQLVKVDGITTNLTKVADNVSGVVATVTSVVNSPLGRVAGIAASFGKSRRTTAKQAKTTAKRK